VSTIAAWQCLSVNEFISQCNWKNISFQALTTSVAQRKNVLTAWQCLTTEDFFALSNWSGKVVSVDGLEQSAREQVTFAVTLTSAQFWPCFNWLGEKEIPSPQKVEQILAQTKEAVAAVEEFTLNDLSQLF
jgi:hypothetical protein